MTVAKDKARWLHSLDYHPFLLCTLHCHPITTPALSRSAAFCRLRIHVSVCVPVTVCETICAREMLIIPVECILGPPPNKGEINALYHDTLTDKLCTMVEGIWKQHKAVLQLSFSLNSKQ